MHTRLQRYFRPQPVFHALLLVCFVATLEPKSPRTFSPQTVTQMSKEKFMAPIDKRLLARKPQAAVVAVDPKVVDAQATEDAIEPQGTKKRKHKKRNKETAQEPGWFAGLFQWQPRKKLLSEMTFDEVIVSKNRVMAGKNYVSGLKYIERALRLADDIDETEKLLLEYANTLYICQRYEKASRAYNELVNLYPGSDEAEYALYQAVVCSSMLILDAERDQTKTNETIDLANQFLQRADVFVEYKEKVEAIKQSALRTLAQSEFDRCRFYINSAEYSQAQHRLNGIRKDWLVKLPDLEPDVLVLECTIAEKQKKPDLISEKKKELQDKFPQATIELAQNKQRTNFLHRF